MINVELVRSILWLSCLMGCVWVWTPCRADEPRYRWEPVTMEAPWAPRDGAGILSYRGALWLLGGWNPGDKRSFPLICNNEVWSSTDGKAWTLVKPNTFRDKSFDPESDWEGRHCAGYVVFKDKMWIVGGDCNQGHYQNDVWNSSDGKTWRHVNKGRPVPWAPRSLHHTAVHDGKLWVIGGQTIPQAVSGVGERFYRDVWTSTDGIEWQQVHPEEPFWPARGMIGGTAVMNGRIWILGGGTYDTPTTPVRKYFNDVWSSADGMHWTCHTESAAWLPRNYHEVAAHDGRLWVMEGVYPKGGETARNRNDVWHSADGVHWTEVPGTPWKPRHAAGLVAHDGALWMIGGNNMQPDVWKLVRADP